MEKSLSLRERLILANQYEILSRLAEDEYEKKQFENLREIFTSGYTRYCSMATEHISEEVSNEECQFVLDVLDLYRDLYFSREYNSEAKEIIPEKDVLFKGFDLYDPIQVKYYSFYKFLVKDLGRYQEIKELINSRKIEGYNSHGFGPCMDKLARMVEKRKQIRTMEDQFRKNYLSIAEIKEILNA